MSSSISSSERVLYELKNSIKSGILYDSSGVENGVVTGSALVKTDSISVRKSNDSFILIIVFFLHQISGRFVVI